ETMTQCSFALRRVRLVCSSAALGLLLSGIQVLAAEQNAQGASSAPPAPRSVQKSGRAGPKRRAGSEGSEEAKMDANQARELYIRRKLRLEQIRAQQEELTKDQRALATN